MEFVEGASLGELADEGTFAIDEAVGIAAQLADGVAAVHEAGVLHRDIKLDNLVITYDGILKLVDFGLAILDDEEVTRLTKDGHVIGTVGYIAPELVLTGEACETIRCISNWCRPLSIDDGNECPSLKTNISGFWLVARDSKSNFLRQ